MVVVVAAVQLLAGTAATAALEPAVGAQGTTVAPLEYPATVDLAVAAVEQAQVLSFPVAAMAELVVAVAVDLPGEPVVME